MSERSYPDRFWVDQDELACTSEVHDGVGQRNSSHRDVGDDVELFEARVLAEKLEIFRYVTQGHF
jgi:hypothetical protein